MRRIKVLLLCAVLFVGGCKTLGDVAEVMVAGAVVAGAALINYHYYHGHHGHHGHGHHGH